MAVGGNALIKRKDLRSVEDQYRALCETMEHVADIVAHGCRVVVTHGNGPQVGFIMLRSEIARDVAGLHIVPLSSCVADTQGAIGWQIQQALGNALARRGLAGHAVTVVTQVLVDPADPGFADPDKPIGEFYTDGQLEELKGQHPDWILKPDANRGWRRVVPSPKPVEIVELDAVRCLVAAGFHVVAAGGGGIPVMRSLPGPDHLPAVDGLLGIDAVVDKDLTASLMAQNLGADLLIIATAVENVCLNFGTPLERPLSRVTMAEMEAYLQQGHFDPGSMAPKIQAAVDFLRHGGQEVIITNPQNLGAALTHDQGTHIVR